VSGFAFLVLARLLVRFVGGCGGFRGSRLRGRRRRWLGFAAAGQGKMLAMAIASAMPSSVLDVFMSSFPIRVFFR
jgi:hypothetical protein